MKRKRFTQEQIIKAINDHAAGNKVNDICHKLGIAHGTFYNWSSKYAGLKVNDASRLRELETENTRIKRHLEKKLQEIEALKDILSMKMVKVCDKKIIVAHMIERHRVSEYRACLLSGISRTAYRYQATSDRNVAGKLADSVNTTFLPTT
jgi:putative transposase